VNLPAAARSDMDTSGILNLKPFDAVRPTSTGVDLAARSLRATPHGDIGRYASEPKSEHEQLTDQTQTWVAQSFFGTLLKQMRNSPFKSELFSGGQGGEAFASLHDQQLAEHMARGAGNKLVHSIVRHIEANAAYKRQEVSKANKTDNRTPEERSEKPKQLRTHAPTARRS
jgi:Rod binding domain-containing protein